MCAHPHSGLRRPLVGEGSSFERVEALLDRIHPDEHAVKGKQLLSHLISTVVRVDDWLERRRRGRANAAKTPCRR